MKTKWKVIAGSGVLILGIALSGVGFAKSDSREVRDGTIRVENQTEADFPDMAKITFDEAIQHSLDVASGKILKMKLEDENGFLVYETEVVTPDKAVIEVIVDAGTGQVLAMENDKPDHDGRDSDNHDHDRDDED